MSRCRYPGCYLQEHEDGEHKLGRPEKPWGALRLVQEFVSRSIRCDMAQAANHPWVFRAEAFYADMLGFGWALCSACARQCQVPPVEYFQRGRITSVAEPPPVVPLEMPAHAQTAKVLQFRKAGT